MRGMFMQNDNSNKSQNKPGSGKQNGGFVSIEKKISRSFAQTVMVCCIVLGIITSILSYNSSINAVSSTINNTSDVAAYYVAAALEQHIAIAYETGSIARLSSPDLSVEDKAAILNQKMNEHDFERVFLVDSNGIDILTGTDFSDRKFFTETMQGNEIMAQIEIPAS